MKVLFGLSSIVTCIICCSCGEHPDGESKISRTQDALGNYHFSYKVSNSEGDHFREEGTDASGRVIGSYGLKHVDGTHRVVDYIADKGGFRASIRSNEPGLANSEHADATIAKSDHNVPLSVAATSNDHTRQIFGKRIDAETSKVEYVGEDSFKSTDDEESTKESRQRNFDDYRPLNPVAYYPSDTRRPLSPSVARTVNQARSPRILMPSNYETDSKPSEVYLPPIDPHSVLRRPHYLPDTRKADDSFFPATTSRKPYIPPYGGFDDDEEDSIERRPGLAIPPSLRSDNPAVPTSSPDHISRKFPLSVLPEHRNFARPRFPPSSVYPRSPNGAEPPIPQGVLFSPPSYDGRAGSPTVVLRAVPIPNGIQAVRIDPTTGRVYERLVYPLFLRHDGLPEYDRNILLHNDDVSDDDSVHEKDPGYLDMPYIRETFRGARNQPPYNDNDRRHRNESNNRSYKIDEHSLSEPTAADVSWIKKQLDLVEGFNRNHFTDGLRSNRHLHHVSHFPERDPFEDDRRPLYNRRSPELRYRSSSDLLSDFSSSSDDLAPEGSKKILAKLQEEPIKTDQEKNISESKSI